MNEGKKDRRDPIRTTKPRNFVAKNATTSGAGAHKDKKKAMKQGELKHKKKEATYETALIKELTTKLKETSDLAQQMMAFAQSRGMNPKLRTGPQPAKPASVPQSPKKLSPEERETLEVRLAALEKELARDPDYEYSDDHRVWKRGHNLKMAIMDIKKQLAKDSGVEEYQDRMAGVGMGNYVVDEGIDTAIDNAIYDLRSSKPGLDRETFLDELYSYLDAEYGKRTADAAMDHGDDRTYDEWYATYSGVSEAVDYGWTTESLADRLFDSENTYEQSLNNKLKEALKRRSQS